MKKKKKKGDRVSSPPRATPAVRVQETGFIKLTDMKLIDTKLTNIKLTDIKLTDISAAGYPCTRKADVSIKLTDTIKLTGTTGCSPLSGL